MNLYASTCTNIGVLIDDVVTKVMYCPQVMPVLASEGGEKKACSWYLYCTRMRQLPQENLGCRELLYAFSPSSSGLGYETTPI